MDGSQSFAKSLIDRADEGHMPGWGAPERGKNPRNQLINKDLNAEAELDVKSNASVRVAQSFLNSPFVHFVKGSNTTSVTILFYT